MPGFIEGGQQAGLSFDVSANTAGLDALKASLESLLEVYGKFEAEGTRAQQIASTLNNTLNSQVASINNLKTASQGYTEIFKAQESAMNQQVSGLRAIKTEAENAARSLGTLKQRQNEFKASLEGIVGKKQKVGAIDFFGKSEQKIGAFDVFRSMITETAKTTQNPEVARRMIRNMLSTAMQEGMIDIGAVSQPYPAAGGGINRKRLERDLMLGYGATVNASMSKQVASQQLQVMGINARAGESARELRDVGAVIQSGRRQIIKEYSRDAKRLIDGITNRIGELPIEHQFLTGMRGVQVGQTGWVMEQLRSGKIGKSFSVLYGKLSEAVVTGSEELIKQHSDSISRLLSTKGGLRPEFAKVVPRAIISSIKRGTDPSDELIRMYGSIDRLLNAGLMDVAPTHQSGTIGQRITSNVVGNLTGIKQRVTETRLDAAKRETAEEFARAFRHGITPTIPSRIESVGGWPANLVMPSQIGMSPSDLAKRARIFRTTANLGINEFADNIVPFPTSVIPTSRRSGGFRMVSVQEASEISKYRVGLDPGVMNEARRIYGSGGLVSDKDLMKLIGLSPQVQPGSFPTSKLLINTLSDRMKMGSQQFSSTASVHGLFDLMTPKTLKAMTDSDIKESNRAKKEEERDLKREQAQRAKDSKAEQAEARKAQAEAKKAQSQEARERKADLDRIRWSMQGGGVWQGGGGGGRGIGITGGFMGGPPTENMAMLENFGRETSFMLKRHLEWLFTGAILFGVTNAFKQLFEEEANFEKALKRVISVTKEGDSGLEVLRKGIIDVDRSMFEAAETAQTMYHIVSMGLGQTSQGYLDINNAIRSADDANKMATLGMYDANTAAIHMGTTLQQFKMPISESARVIDTFAFAAAKSATEIPKLGEAMKYVGTIANEAGLGIEETAGMMMQLANAGIRGTDMGEKLRNVIKRLIDPTKEAAKTMADAGISFEKVDSTGKRVGMNIWERLGAIKEGIRTKPWSEQMKILSTLFEQRALPAALVMMRTSKEDIDRMINPDIVRGSAEEQFKKMTDNVIDSWKKFGAEMGRARVNLARPFVEDVGKMTKSLVDFSTWLKKAIELHPGEARTVTGIAGSLLTVGGFALGGYLMNKMATAGSGLGGMAKGLLMNPLIDNPFIYNNRGVTPDGPNMLLPAGAQIGTGYRALHPASGDTFVAQTRLSRYMARVGYAGAYGAGAGMIPMRLPPGYTISGDTLTGPGGLPIGGGPYTPFYPAMLPLSEGPVAPATGTYQKPGMMARLNNYWRYTRFNPSAIPQSAGFGLMSGMMAQSLTGDANWGFGVGAATTVASAFPKIPAGVSFGIPLLVAAIAGNMKNAANEAEKIKKYMTEAGEESNKIILSNAEDFGRGVASEVIASGGDKSYLVDLMKSTSKEMLSMFSGVNKRVLSEGIYISQKDYELEMKKIKMWGSGRMNILGPITKDIPAAIAQLINKEGFGSNKSVYPDQDAAIEYKQRLDELKARLMLSGEGGQKFKDITNKFIPELNAAPGPETAMLVYERYMKELKTAFQDTPVALKKIMDLMDKNKAKMIEDITRQKEKNNLLADELDIQAAINGMFDDYTSKAIVARRSIERQSLKHRLGSSIDEQGMFKLAMFDVDTVRRSSKLESHLQKYSSIASKMDSYMESRQPKFIPAGETTSASTLEKAYKSVLSKKSITSSDISILSAMYSPASNSKFRLNTDRDKFYAQVNREKAADIEKIEKTRASISDALKMEIGGEGNNDSLINILKERRRRLRDRDKNFKGSTGDLNLGSLITSIESEYSRTGMMTPATAKRAEEYIRDTSKLETDWLGSKKDNEFVIKAQVHMANIKDLTKKYTDTFTRQKEVWVEASDKINSHIEQALVSIKDGIRQHKIQNMGKYQSQITSIKEEYSKSINVLNDAIKQAEKTIFEANLQLILARTTGDKKGEARAKDILMTAQANKVTAENSKDEVKKKAEIELNKVYTDIKDRINVIKASKSGGGTVITEFFIELRKIKEEFDGLVKDFGDIDPKFKAKIAELRDLMIEDLKFRTKVAESQRIQSNRNLEDIPRFYEMRMQGLNARATYEENMGKMRESYLSEIAAAGNDPLQHARIRGKYDVAEKEEYRQFKFAELKEEMEMDALRGRNLSAYYKRKGQLAEAEFIESKLRIEQEYQEEIFNAAKSGKKKKEIEEYYSAQMRDAYIRRSFDRSMRDATFSFEKQMAIGALTSGTSLQDFQRKVFDTAKSEQEELMQYRADDAKRKDVVEKWSAVKAKILRDFTLDIRNTMLESMDRTFSIIAEIRGDSLHAENQLVINQVLLERDNRILTYRGIAGMEEQINRESALTIYNTRRKYDIAYKNQKLADMTEISGYLTSIAGVAGFKAGIPEFGDIMSRYLGLGIQRATLREDETKPAYLKMLGFASMAGQDEQIAWEMKQLRGKRQDVGLGLYNQAVANKDLPRANQISGKYGLFGKPTTPEDSAKQRDRWMKWIPSLTGWAGGVDESLKGYRTQLAEKEQLKIQVEKGWYRPGGKDLSAEEKSKMISGLDKDIDTLKKNIEKFGGAVEEYGTKTLGPILQDILVNPKMTAEDAAVVYQAIVSAFERQKKTLSILADNVTIDASKIGVPMLDSISVIFNDAIKSGFEAILPKVPDYFPKTTPADKIRLDFKINTNITIDKDGKISSVSSTSTGGTTDTQDEFMNQVGDAVSKLISKEFLGRGIPTGVGGWGGWNR